MLKKPEHSSTQKSPFNFGNCLSNSNSEALFANTLHKPLLTSNQFTTPEYANTIKDSSGHSSVNLQIGSFSTFAETSTKACLNSVGKTPFKRDGSSSEDSCNVESVTQINKLDSNCQGNEFMSKLMRKYEHLNKKLVSEDKSNSSPVSTTRSAASLEKGSLDISLRFESVSSIRSLEKDKDCGRNQELFKIKDQSTSTKGSVDADYSPQSASGKTPLKRKGLQNRNASDSSQSKKQMFR